VCITPRTNIHNTNKSGLQKLETPHLDIPVSDIIYRYMQYNKKGCSLNGKNVVS